MKGASLTLPVASPPPSNEASPQPGNSDVDPHKYVVCAKFRRDSRLAESSSSWWRRGSRDAGLSEEPRKNSASGAEPASNEEDGVIEDDRSDGHVVIVLKLLDECGMFLALTLMGPTDMLIYR